MEHSDPHPPPSLFAPIIELGIVVLGFYIYHLLLPVAPLQPLPSSEVSVRGFFLDWASSGDILGRDELQRAAVRPPSRGVRGPNWFGSLENQKPDHLKRF